MSEFLDCGVLEGARSVGALTSLFEFAFEQTV
jgi:hypothetical protein